MFAAGKILSSLTIACAMLLLCISLVANGESMESKINQGAAVQELTMMPVPSATELDNESGSIKNLLTEPTVFIHSTEIANSGLAIQQQGILAAKSSLASLLSMHHQDDNPINEQDDITTIGQQQQTTSGKLNKHQQQFIAKQQQQIEQHQPALAIIPLDISRRRASEKVKKGLSSLLYQWNNTPFYSATTNVVNGDTNIASVSGTSDTHLITPGTEGLSTKSSAKLTTAQSRPLGRPLRWG